MSTRMIALRGGVDPSKLKGQRRIVVETMKSLNAVGKKMVSIETVIKKAGKRLKLRKPGPTPTMCVNFHVRALRNKRQLTEKKAA